MTCCPDPTPGVRPRRRRPAHPLRRRAAGVGEAQGGARGRDRHRVRRGAQRRRRSRRWRDRCGGCAPSRRGRRSTTSSRAACERADAEIFAGSAPDSASSAASATSSAPRRPRWSCSSSSPRSGSRSARCGGCPSCRRSRRIVPPDALRFGTVGKPLAGVELRLADDGELLVRGADRDGRLPQPAGQDRRGDRRRRLAAHRRHRRARRRRLPADRRPQEGADHQRRRQEHVAGQHRAAAQAGLAADRPGDRDRRPPSLQRRADRAGPRRLRRLRRPARPAGPVAGGDVGPPRCWRRSTPGSSAPTPT